MNKKIIIAICFIFFAFFAIYIFLFNPFSNIKKTNKEGEIKKVGLDQTFTISKNQTAILVDKKSIELKLINVSDSRCPKDVACVWAGELSYTILIDGEEYTISTYTSKKINYGDYIFTIVEEKCSENELAIKIEKDSKVKEIELKETFTVKMNQTVVFNEEKLVIELINVSDSRCPKDANCFWEGELEYTILINNQMYTISTVLNQTITYGNYMFTIIEKECSEDELAMKIQKI